MAGSKLLKYLPKPTSFSIPAGSNTNRAGFSGPIIPKEARRTRKAIDGGGGAFEAEEPTSPKVSCIGQVKNKKQQPQKMKTYGSFDRRRSEAREEPSKLLVKAKKHQSFSERRPTAMRKEEPKAEKKRSSGIQGMFRRKAKPGLPPAAPIVAEEEAAAPEVGRMRRYASGRETLGDFDWRAVAVGPAEGDDDDDDEEREEVMVAHSGPILLGGGGGGFLELEKRKEVNIWKRRTLTAPEPLQL